MSINDDEVLLKNGDLSNYLSKSFGEDFETYEGFTESPITAESVLKNRTCAPNLREEDVPGLTSVSEQDHKLVCQILQSKLLFLEDLEIIEGLFSKCIVEERCKIWSLSTLAIASSSLLSIAVLCLKAPTALSLSFSSFSAGLLIWENFKRIEMIRYLKLLSSYIRNLQILCYNIHSLLRFLKETEILSTGQVSTDNIGSAMYFPLSDLDLAVIPSWKLLPHLRQCLYDSISETITILADACDIIKDNSPAWLYISGFTLKTPANGKEPEQDLSKEKYHSIKKLQDLCEIYLKVQSEFLRWIAFNLCPYVWTGSSNSFSVSKRNMFKILQKTSISLSAISSKLKLQYDMIEIFSYHKPNPSRSLQFSFGENKTFDFQNIQTDLHNIFLSALLMLQKTKSLEDKMEETTNLFLISNKELDLHEIEESLMYDLSSVRSDLLRIIRAYEELHSRFVSKAKASQTVLKDEKTEGSLSRPEESTGKAIGKVQTAENAKSELRYGINSPDEVFLAISGARPEKSEIFYDDLWMERKPQIPKTLLNELSTTLIPIKKGFQEREKLALERSGLQDIQDESTNKSNLEVLAHKSGLRQSSYNSLERQDSDSSFSSIEDIRPNSELYSLFPESSENLTEKDEESKSLNRPISLTISSLAEALNTASHNFVRLEEEFYSEDEERN